MGPTLHAPNPKSIPSKQLLSQEVIKESKINAKIKPKIILIIVWTINPPTIVGQFIIAPSVGSILPIIRKKRNINPPTIPARAPFLRILLYLVNCEGPLLFIILIIVGRICNNNC